MPVAVRKAAKRIHKHRKLILKRFKADGLYSSGVVEGFNNKAKLTTIKAYGFKSLHTIGALLEPKTTHRLFGRA